jgi:hypothetical protein
MPNWRKVVISGSDSNLNSLVVNTTITASSITASFTGSLLGSSSYSDDSGLLNGTGSVVFATTGSNEFSGSQVITGSVFLSNENDIFVNNLPLYEQALQDAFTGIISGGILTINEDNPQAYNISAGAGYIVDNYSDPENPEYTYVSWPELIVTASAFPGPGQNATQPRTNIAIDVNGNVFEKADKFTPQDYREKIVLGRIVHVTSPVITRTLSLPLTTYSRGFHWFDLASAVGPINIGGNIYSAGGTDRTIQKSSGQTYRVGTNYVTDPTSPDITTDSGENPVTFRYRFRSGSNFTEAAPTTLVTGSLYDNGSGALQSVNNNQWTVQRIFFFAATGTTIIQFGQFLYNSKSAAQLTVLNETFVTDPNLSEDAILRGYLIVRGGATNLSSTDDAEFLEATAGAAGGGAGGTVTTLESLSDVTFPTTLINGQTIIRSGSQWINGYPDSASFATTSSFANTVTSASFATTSSFALTASYAENAGAGAGFPFEGDAEITGSLTISGSVVDFTEVTAISGSIFSGSFVGDGSGLTNITTEITSVTTFSEQFSSQTSITVNHVLDTENPIVQVYDHNDEQIIPTKIKILNNNQVLVEFSVEVSGKIVVAKGGHLIDAANLSYIAQSFSNTTLVPVTHSFGTDAPIVQVYDDSSLQIIPQEIRIIDENSLEVELSINTSGKVAVSRGGHIISAENGITGSFIGSFSATEDILPTVTDQINLGSETQRFKDIYLSGSTIFLGSVKLSEGENGSLKIVNSTEEEVVVGAELGNRIDALEIESGSIRTTFNSFTGSSGVLSSSIQVDHNSSTNYVANQHIDHTTINISAGNGISGGGSIASSRTLTLDTGSVHFTGGVKTKLNTDGVISGSAQVDINSATGTLNVNKGGTGQTSFNNGELLIGNTTGNTLVKATLTGTTDRITVTNGAGSITINADATSSNAANKIVARDGSGNFSAGAITATSFVGPVTGNASTATALQNVRTLWGQNFDGTGNVTGNLTSVGNITGTAGVTLQATSAALALAATGANAITLSTNAVERVRVTSAGNVGIGTTSPANTLEVSGTANGTSLSVVRFRNAGTSTSTASSLLLTTNTGVGSSAASSVIQSVAENTSGDSALVLQTPAAGTATTRLRITSAGNVGIGTETPGNRLSVLTAAGGNTSGFSVGSTNGLLNIWGGAASGVVLDITNGTLNGSTGTDFLIRQGGTTRCAITSAGNVGIGTTSPGQIIHGKATNPFLQLERAGGANVYVGSDSTGMYIGSDGNIPIYFTTNNVERARITAGGELLVGTTSADVGGSVTGIALVPGGKVLASNTLTDIFSGPFYGDRRGTNNTGPVYALAMGGFLKADIGIVGTNSTADDAVITFNTITGNATRTERMRITSAGNVGIGTTSNQSTWAADKAGLLSVESAAQYTNLVAMAYNTGSPSGGSVLTLGRSRSATLGTRAVTSSGDLLGIVSFEGVNTGSSMVSAGYILGSQDGAAGASFIPGALRFFTATNAAAPTERMRITSTGELLTGGKTTATANGGDVQVSSGITFPATQVAKSDPNTLDDYEEGTFTPSWSSSGASFTYDATFRHGRYVKVGRIVHFSLFISTASAPTGTTTNILTITGLPFTVANDDNANRFGLSIGQLWRITRPAGATQATAETPRNTSSINLRWSESGAIGSAWIAEELLSDSYLIVAGSYIASS